LFLSFQSSSINPFPPISPLIPSAQVSFRSTSFSSSRWTPFHNFFRQSSLYLYNCLRLKIFFK
jgi:hypothetical protein